MSFEQSCWSLAPILRQTGGGHGIARTRWNLETGDLSHVTSGSFSLNRCGACSTGAAKGAQLRASTVFGDQRSSLRLPSTRCGASVVAPGEIGTRSLNAGESHAQEDGKWLLLRSLPGSVLGSGRSLALRATRENGGRCPRLRRGNVGANRANRIGSCPDSHAPNLSLSGLDAKCQDAKLNRTPAGPWTRAWAERGFKFPPCARESDGGAVDERGRTGSC